MINMPSPVGNGWKKQDGYLVPNYLTKYHSPKNIESLMTCTCTTGCRTKICRCRKNSHGSTEVFLCPENTCINSKQLTNSTMYDEEYDVIVTRNMKRKTMMVSYNQRLAIVIINVEGFKNLQIDLHD